MIVFRPDDLGERLAAIRQQRHLLRTHAQALRRPLSDLILPHGDFLHPIVSKTRQTKTLHLQGFREIAGAGFEPATFGL